MLKFLAREQSNVDKIESLKRKTRDVHSSLKRVQLARAAIEAEQYVANAPIANRVNNLVGIFDRGEVRGVLDCQVNELEQKFEIETVVTKTLGRIISKLEMLDPNFHRNQSKKGKRLSTHTCSLAEDSTYQSLVDLCRADINVIFFETFCMSQLCFIFVNFIFPK